MSLLVVVSWGEAFPGLVVDCRRAAPGGPGYTPGLEQQLVESLGPGFLAAYERLIAQVVGPHLLAARGAEPRAALEDQEAPEHREAPPVEEDGRECALLFQFPPTLRVKRGEGTVGRMHSDAEYGHQDCEVNFWMPLPFREEEGGPVLAPGALSRRHTLWCEDPEGWGPFLLEVGEIQRFWGAKRRHFFVDAECERPHSRVTLDFRICLEADFDPTWRLPGVRFEHQRRRMRFVQRAKTWRAD